MHSSDHSRDPCPYNIVSDVGVGFCMGAIGGTLWHGFKGFRNSPRGERWSGSLTSIKARAPIIGGNFAVWSGLFNAVDCAIAGVREKEDGWNPIIAGASTGAILAGRSGPKAMMVSAIFGGCILAVMEGVGALINRMNSEAYKPQAPVLPDNILQQSSTKEEIIKEGDHELLKDELSNKTIVNVKKEDEGGFSPFKGKFRMSH